MEILRKGSFRIVSGDAETAPFRKISTPGNQVKLRYFSQWMFPEEFSNIFRITIKRIHLGGQWLTTNNTTSSKARCNGQKCFQFHRRFCKTVSFQIFCCFIERLLSDDFTNSKELRQMSLQTLSEFKADELTSMSPEIRRKPMGV